MKDLDRFGRFVNRRELQALAARLEEGEHVLAAVEAHAERSGVLAVTDRRVVFVTVGLLRKRLQAWPHRAVLGLAHRTRVDDAEATLRTQQGNTVWRLRKADAKELQRAYDARPRGPGELVDFALPPAEAKRRERLARLDRMLQRGSVTKAEYERSKRALVDEAE